VRALNPGFLRNIDDRAIKAIARRGGVVGVNLSRKHLGKYGVLDHINYLVDNFGIGSAAIGTDFDGINDPVYPGPARLVGLREAMRDHGYTAADIQKVFSGNFTKMCRRYSL
jgi:microsomal dipeptidase-like Zn-dependent dipeptidase